MCSIHSASAAAAAAATAATATTTTTGVTADLEHFKCTDKCRCYFTAKPLVPRTVSIDFFA